MMKDSKLPQTEIIPTIKKVSHHSFRNMMLLILFALAVWSWFYYLPQHAMDAISLLNTQSSQQIDKWMGIESTPEMDYSLMLPAQTVPATTITSGEVMSGEINTGASQTGEIINTQTGAQSKTGTTQNGSNQTGTTSVRDEIDTTSEIVVSADTGTIPATIETTSSPLSITIGGQTITLDGTPDEDIVINGYGYTITVQKN